MLYKAYSWNMMAYKSPYGTNCFPNLAISLKLLFFKERIKVLDFQLTQFCSIMYKDHPDGSVSLLKVYNKSY